MKPHNGEKECRPWNDCIVATLPLACKKNVGDAHAAVRRCCWKRSNSIHDSIMPYDIKKSTAKPLRVLVVPAPAGPGQPAIERGAQSRQVALAGGAGRSIQQGRQEAWLPVPHAAVRGRPKIKRKK